MKRSIRQVVAMLIIMSTLFGAAAIAAARGRGVDADGTYEVQVSGVAGLPDDLAAVALQVTVSNSRKPGYLTVYSCDAKRPPTSNVNFEAGRTSSNLTLVKLGSSGRACIYSHATADLVVDVMGAFGATEPWVQIDNKRAIDTRRPEFGQTNPKGGSIIAVPLTFPRKLASEPTLAALNVTAISHSDSGYLTVYPCDSSRPSTSNLNFRPSKPATNLVLVPVRDQQTCIYMSAPTDVIVDVTAASSATDGFEMHDPRRLIDTRVGLDGKRLEAGKTLRVNLSRSDPGAAILNVTAVSGATKGFFTVYNCDEDRPATSNVNFDALGPSSTATLVEPSAEGEICLFSSRSADVVIDSMGWLTANSGYLAIPPFRIVDTRISYERTDKASKTTKPTPTTASTTNPTTSTSTPPTTPATTTPATTTPATTTPATTTPATTTPATTTPAPQGGLNYHPADWTLNEGQDWRKHTGEGAFRLLCGPGQIAYDDPIVFPGEPGRSHLHQFFGNLNVDAHTTIANIRESGESTCDGGPLNRSGYWFPAMIDGETAEVVKPDIIVAYYKGLRPDTQRLPGGLAMIAGYDPSTGENTTATWKCNNVGTDGIDPNCSGDLQLTVRFPACWDGVNLDSANHRAHMAYGMYNGWGDCPSTHPVMLPHITLNIHWSDIADARNWKVASDLMESGAVPGETAHADWINGWNAKDASDVWFENCVAPMLDCGTSSLGDGVGLVSSTADIGRLRVPVPAR